VARDKTEARGVEHKPNAHTAFVAYRIRNASWYRISLKMNDKVNKNKYKPQHH
jgi:hypothetical protein